MIISCDLPSEANKDCNGRSGGLAFIDDCGVCSGGDTEIIPNIDKDLCGACFGSNSCYEPHCNDEASINYFENALNIDNSLCIYDLCDENNSYINSNDDFNCDVQGNPPYEIGEYLSCETLQKEFDICYPEDCGSVKLADFEGKNILIIYEFDW